MAALTRIVKARGDHAHTPARSNIPRDPTHHRSQIDHHRLAVLDLEVIALLHARLDRHLQRDRRLPLEAHLRRHAQQRRHRIEQPPARRRRHRLQPPRHHRLHQRHLPLADTAKPRQLRRNLRPERIPQIAQRHPPRLPHRRIPTRERHIPQMPATLESRQIRDQKLPTPDRAIGPVSRPIHRHTDHLAAQMVLRHAARDVRVMMLHPDLPLDLRSQRQPRTPVVRM